jgi:hypothetical protein
MNKEKIVSILIGSVLATFLALVVINGFFMSYFLTFRSPVIIQMPIQVHKRVEPLSPTPTPKKVKVTLTPTATPTPKLKVDIKKIYQLESSGGKNDGCRNKGLYNGYGYGQNSFVWNCFPSHEEVTNKVIAWFKDKEEKGYSIAEQLCMYNVGKRITNCDYVIAYNSL